MLLPKPFFDTKFLIETFWIQPTSDIAEEFANVQAIPPKVEPHAHEGKRPVDHEDGLVVGFPKLPASLPKFFHL